jgi:outer membrane usher protein
MLYRGRYGDASVEYAAGGDTRFSDAISVAGGLALIGGGVYPTRPITGSFALVDVPGLSGARVYLDNQDIGKTDAHGKLLVPGLLPNYGNVIRIDDAAAPMNTSIQTEQRLIAPPSKGAAIVRFEAQRLVALTGSLTVRRNGKTIVPSYGELQIAGGTYTNRSDIGQNGEFYLENVPAGSYQAHVLFAQGECIFRLHVPESQAVLTRLGTLQCGA